MAARTRARAASARARRRRLRAGYTMYGSHRSESDKLATLRAPAAQHLALLRAVVYAGLASAPKHRETPLERLLRARSDQESAEIWSRGQLVRANCEHNNNEQQRRRGAEALSGGGRADLRSRLAGEAVGAGDEQRRVRF